MQSATPQQAAILWLSIGEYEESHPLCQDDASDLGSYLHGIVHRQEGDLSNAQYWFRRSAIRIEGIDPNRLSPDQIQKELVALMDLAK